MYNTPYSNNYNQLNLDRINNQIAELEKMKSQISQQPIQPPTNLTQNLKSFENYALEDKIKKIYSYNKYLNYYINKHSEYELRNK